MIARRGDPVPGENGQRNMVYFHISLPDCIGRLQRKPAPPWPQHGALSTRLQHYIWTRDQVKAVATERAGECGVRVNRFEEGRFRSLLMPLSEVWWVSEKTSND